MKLFKYKLIRFMAFILLWLALSHVISLFNQPAFAPPNVIFRICANQMNDERILPTYLLKDYEQNPSGYQLCRVPFVKETAFAEVRFVFTQNADGSYLLKLGKTVLPTLWNITTVSQAMRLSPSHGDVGAVWLKSWRTFGVWY